MKSDIVIIGGGLIGLYTAYTLLPHTRQITVIDKHEFGQQSSWAAGGILSPLLPWHYNDTVNDLTADANQVYQEQQPFLFEHTNIDIEFWQCGLDILDSAQKASAKSWAKKYKFDLTETETYFRLPAISQIRTPRLIKALIAYLEQRNVRLLPCDEVYNINLKKEKVIDVETSTGKILTGHVVCSSGAWTEQLVKNITGNLSTGLQPIRGQIVAFEGNGIELKSILYSNNHYLIPRQDGLILAGSTVENAGFENIITQQAREELKNKSYDLMPALQTRNILHHWSGLRPGSKDNMPIIGPHPFIEGLYLNCGHHRYGVAMAPRSANILTQWITNPTDSNKDTRFLLHS